MIRAQSRAAWSNDFADSNEFMTSPQTTSDSRLSDPSAWLDAHGDYLYRYALVRLRDRSLAEDAVQETLVAALRSPGSFGGRATERTWLVGILKHKIVDHFRKTAREAPFDSDEGKEIEPNHLFMQTGEWVGHWVAAAEPEKASSFGPFEWRATPEDFVARTEFWTVFDGCLKPVPPRLASAFTLREIDGLSSEEICDILGVSVQNLWVMLHRARAHLRNCLEQNWFKPAAGGR
jgi:RNA polymerase sigma-70 factor, ECF subfamily